jgi:translation elongation factor EF-1alpha
MSLVKKLIRKFRRFFKGPGPKSGRRKLRKERPAKLRKTKKSPLRKKPSRKRRILKIRRRNPAQSRKLKKHEIYSKSSSFSRISRISTVENKNDVIVGQVTHYFSKIMVCVVRIDHGMIVSGDNVRILGSTTNFVQKVNSMQIESVEVNIAKKGQLIGLKVSKPCREGDKIIKIMSI